MPRREPDDLASLGSKLDAARGVKGKQPDRINVSGVAIAFRLLTELMAAVVVGLGLGWLLDWYFRIHLVFLLVMFAFGVAAGIRNVIHVANEMNKKVSGGEEES